MSAIILPIVRSTSILMLKNWQKLPFKAQNLRVCSILIRALRCSVFQRWALQNRMRSQRFKKQPSLLRKWLLMNKSTANSNLTLHLSKALRKRRLKTQKLPAAQTSLSFLNCSQETSATRLHSVWAISKRSDRFFKA